MLICLPFAVQNSDASCFSLAVCTAPDTKPHSDLASMYAFGPVCTTPELAQPFRVNAIYFGDADVLQLLLDIKLFKLTIRLSAAAIASFAFI